jgi:hypothetical protein
MKIGILILPIFMLVGCISPKTYVNPNFGKATYGDIKNVAAKYDTEIAVDFQRNGESLPAVNGEVRNHVERTLRASGVITPSKINTGYSLKVIVNNIANMSEAGVKGFGTGLTFGAVGSTVVDYYEVEVSYVDDKGESFTRNYKHSLHTTIGNEKSPFLDATPTTPADGFGVVVEQVLLNFIMDMQQDGKLSKINTASYNYS